MIRKSFTCAQKLKVIRMANISGISATSRHLDIHKSMISRWIRRENVMQSSKKSTRKIGSGRTPSFPTHEKNVNDYILNLRNQAIPVCYDMIKSKMFSSTPSSFKASNGWLYGFLRRYKLSLRVCTTTVKKRSGDITATTSLEDKLQSFREFVSRSTADW